MANLLQLHIERQRRDTLKVLRHNISKVPDLKIPDSLRSGDVDIQPDNATPIGDGPVLLEGADDQGEDRAGVAERVTEIELVWGHLDLESSLGGIELKAG
jgi:hypothetical protein